MSKLAIRYEPDPEDEVGKLWFTVGTERFSGTAFFWSNLTEIAEIIRKLGQFPLGEPAKWQWGYNETEGSDLVIALGIAQVGHRGELEVIVELADLHDMSQRLTTRLKTDYVAIDALRVGLERMVANHGGEALLAGQ